jgi:hypothetical protein
MRYFALLLSLLGAHCFGAPAGVDGLSPDDVAKAVSALKQDFVRPDALSDEQLARATLQGLLDRLAPAVSLATGTAGAEPATPFYSEAYEGKTGYLRLGDFNNIPKAAAVIKEWNGKAIGAVVLDLRGTPPSSDFDAGAQLARLFCAKGTELFSLTAGKGRALKGADSPSGQTRTFSVESDPVFTGILVVLVDGGTGEAPEAVAASLQKCAKALIVGDKTAGRAFQYSDVPLAGGALLRVAVAQVILPDGKEPGEIGLTPDINVGLGVTSKQQVMDSITARGVVSVIEEHDRAHLNEAALVSGSNPEVDELEAEEAGQKPEEPVIDRQLQRALDLVTSISIYQSKGDNGPKTGE